MKVCSVSLAALAAAFLTQAAHSQTVDTHVAAAKAAAGNEHTVLFDSLCAPAAGPPVRAPGPRPVPERSTWHYEPVKVFDNLSNHTRLDGSATRLPAMATRKAGDPHPYVIGNDAVQRYVKVAEECARANLLRLK